MKELVGRNEGCKLYVVELDGDPPRKARKPEGHVNATTLSDETLSVLSDYCESAFATHWNQHGSGITSLSNSCATQNLCSYKNGINVEELIDN